MNKYKTIIFFVITGILLNGLPSAAQKNHDLSVQYCRASSTDLIDYSEDIFSGFFDIPLSRENIRRSGGVYGTYRYFFMNIMSVSATLGYNRMWADLVTSGELQGESIRDYYTVAAEWNIHYIRLEKFQMYSGGGFGATFLFEDNSYYQRVEDPDSQSEVYPNFNFTLVGVRFGGNLGVFLETGLGYKGLFACGLSLQF
jgi:hypothetical protein